MTRAGLDARTGRPPYGWAHAVQSITKILTTELNSRVQRREFGSEQIRIIDRPQNEETIMDLYVATAQALEPRVIEGRQYGEPGFVLLRTSIDASEPGRVAMLLGGVFFENGHLGDYSNPSQREIVYAVTDNGGGLTFEAV